MNRAKHWASNRAQDIENEMGDGKYMHDILVDALLEFYDAGLRNGRAKERKENKPVTKGPNQ